MSRRGQGRTAVAENKIPRRLGRRGKSGQITQDVVDRSEAVGDTQVGTNAVGLAFARPITIRPLTFAGTVTDFGE